MHGSPWDGYKETVIPFGGEIHVPLLLNEKMVGMRTDMFCPRIAKEVTERKAWEARAGAVAIWSTMSTSALQEVKYSEDDTTSKLARSSLIWG